MCRLRRRDPKGDDGRPSVPGPQGPVQPPGLSPDDAARTIWAVASPEVRQMLVTFAGWSVKRYRAWLEQTLVAALLAPA